MRIDFQRTRLAPSPTGALHLGHARTFLVTWWMARQAGARIHMRMEDLDLSRARPDSIEQAYEDLRWLGMDWDAWTDTQDAKLKTQNEVVQSARMGLYEEVMETLWRKEAVYPCTCSRADIAANVAGAASAPHVGEAVVRYPGTCSLKTQNAKLKAQNVAEVAAALRDETGKNVCWRLRVTAGVRTFDDVIAGRQAMDVAGEVGDFPLTRFDGTPAYQLACVVDDHAMGIDMVVRGDDLLSSSPRQMAVYDAMGWEAPRFAHVPLVVGEDGKRLAKRHGESRIAQFRAAGVSAEKIVGWTAWRCGQIDRPREITASDALAIFDLARLPRERVVLGDEDLAWLR